MLLVEAWRLPLEGLECRVARPHHSRETLGLRQQVGADASPARCLVNPKSFDTKPIESHHRSNSANDGPIGLSRVEPDVLVGRVLADTRVVELAQPAPNLSGLNLFFCGRRNGDGHEG